MRQVLQAHQHIFRVILRVLQVQEGIVTPLRLLFLQQLIASCQGLSQFLLEVGMPALQIGQHACYIPHSTFYEIPVVIECEVIVCELVVDADIVLLIIVRNGL